MYERSLKELRRSTELGLYFLVHQFIEEKKKKREYHVFYSPLRVHPMLFQKYHNNQSSNMIIVQLRSFTVYIFWMPLNPLSQLPYSFVSFWSEESSSNIHSKKNQRMYERSLKELRRSRELDCTSLYINLPRQKGTQGDIKFFLHQWEFIQPCSKNTMTTNLATW